MQDLGLSFPLTENQIQLLTSDAINSTNKESKKITRRKFSPDEDKLLKNLVETFGTSSWSLISAHFPNRTPRQCRDRWKHYLSPEVLVGNWSEEEDELLLKMFKLHGKQWSVIAKFFPGRTDIGIKNHYISLTTRKDRKSNSQKVRQHAVLLPNPIVLGSSESNLTNMIDLIDSNNSNNENNLNVTIDLQNINTNIVQQIQEQIKKLAPDEEQQVKNSISHF